MKSFDRNAFNRGLAHVTPIIPGVIPFGLMAGAIPVETGVSPTMAMFMSIFVFAGASQLAIVQLISDNASYITILLAALVINMRFAMYSASMAQHFKGLGKASRLHSAYLLTDQGFALSVNHFNDKQGLYYKLWYYLGISLPLWVLWQTCTLAGAILGAGIPPEWSLDFAIPLVFLSLVVPAVKDRSMLVAASVSAVVATAIYPVSSSIAILVGALSGVLSAYAFDRIYGYDGAC